MQKQTKEALNHGAPGFPERLSRGRLSRRDMLWLIGVSTGSAATVSLQGCAKSPVTGKNILVGMTEAQERSIDKQVAPHQFSQDLGALQNDETNRYVSNVGGAMSGLTHRPDMPYNFRVLNANYVNAYTFPGGAMGLTRGIMADLNNEAELAALLGHELGHVNARHAAQRQGASMVAQVAVIGVNIAARDSQWGQLTGFASQIGASGMLSKYSRENEREADALGQEYMVRAGYPASGMINLHQLLMSKERKDPNLLQTMFSSHPLPRERAQTAERLARTKYRDSLKGPLNRERYMDNTSHIRQIKPTIKACQKGEVLSARKKYREAEREFGKALRHKRDDYASNVLMSRVLLAQERAGEAQRYADAARKIYPEEAQAHKLAGVSRLARKNYTGAFQALDRFDKVLPGDPSITFLKGVTLEGVGDRRRAADHYYKYASQVQSGDASRYAVSRLRAWGRVR